MSLKKRKQRKRKKNSKRRETSTKPNFTEEDIKSRGRDIIKTLLLCINVSSETRRQL